jgi:hypothetical protein
VDERSGREVKIINSKFAFSISHLLAKYFKVMGLTEFFPRGISKKICLQA